MKLLLDEMIGPRVADRLRARPYELDVVALVERAELRALADDAVLELAHRQGRVLVTRNVADFAVLHQRWTVERRRHHGIVMVTESAFPQTRNLVGALVSAIGAAARQKQLPAPGEVRYLKPDAPRRTPRSRR